MSSVKKWISLLLAVAMIFSVVPLSPAAHAASASDYISYTYSSNIRVKTTRNVDLKTFPAENAGSVTTTVATGTELTVRAMHYSTEGHYWYKVLYYGKTLYCRAAYCTLEEHLTGDLTISNVQSPASIEYGTSFPIKGDVTSTYNLIGKITAGLYKNDHLNATAYMSASDTVNGTSYSLSGSTVDNNLTFGSCARGVYTYAVTAEAVSYYYDTENTAFATSVKDVVLESQQCIVTDWYNPNSSTGWGIDVSVYQGSITWSTTKNYVDFAIIRLGYSTNLDTRFVANAQACESYGIPYGIYLYSHAETSSAAIAEANFVINTLKSYGLTPDLPIFQDIERSAFESLSNTTKQAVGKSFCDTIAAAGFMPGIYTYKSWFYNYFNTSYFDSIAKWIPQIDSYSSNGTSTFDGGLWLWQYTFTGSVSGISGDVDCNYSYFDFDGGKSDTTVWGKSTYYPIHAKGTVNSSVNVRTYPSSSYSSAGTYSSGKEVEILGLYKNTSGEYWYHVNHNSGNYFIYASYIDIDEFLYDDVAAHGISMASNISSGSSYTLSGTVTSKENRLGKVYAKVYSGENTNATAKLTGTDSPASKAYPLANSDVDYDMSFGSLSSGYYTYEVSADIYSYYVSNGTLYYHTENVVIYTAPFTVGGVSITMPESAACSHTAATLPAVDATCTATGLTAGSYCSTCGETLTAQTVVAALGHSYSSGVCTRCGTVCTHNFVNDACTVCGLSCTHIYDSGICTVCGYQCPHDYLDSVCTICQTACTHRYINGECIICGLCCSHEYVNSVCSICAYECPHDYLDGECLWCGRICPHDLYEDGYCAECSTPEICTDYYLFGYINGENYGCEEDAENLGEYLFVNGTITVNFTEDSYVGIKLGDGSIWYMIDGDPAETDDTVVYVDCSDLNVPGKLFIPGRRDVTLTMTVNDDGSLTVTRSVAPCTHDWGNGECTICWEVCGHDWQDLQCSICGVDMPLPEITLKNYSVSFDGEVRYNVYFTLANAEYLSLEDMGLLTWTTAQSSGTYDTAHAVIPGALTDGTQYMVHSNGIPAKELSDTVYFKIYIRLADGSYIYSDMKTVNAKNYAMGRLENSTSESMKALCVAMLNYGAAAQTYFNYKSYNLMNSGLTDEQKSLVREYSSDMVAASVAVSSEKAGSFVKNGFGTCTITASFEGAFVLNYYLNTTYTPDLDVTLYYWTLDDFNSVDVLTVDNATGSMVTLPTDIENQYWGEVTGIAAKELDQTVFVAAVYQSDGVEYSTSVMNYSMGRYCVKLAANDDSAQQELAKATAVYGYYAKQYFQN